MRPTIAVQLYTLRDAAAENMLETLRRVKEIGYEGVELAGYGDLNPGDLTRALEDLELNVVGSHVSFGALQEDLGGIVAENERMNNTHLVCPSIPGAQRNALGYIEFAHQLEAIGREIKGAGMTLCYHNHAFELEDRYDDLMGLDILYLNSDASLVQAEIDTFWIQKGGSDPAAYIRQYAGRVPLLHVKDMTNDVAQTFAEVGAGTMNWPEIFAAAKEAGVKAYIVEQDVCAGDPFDSIKISLDNLREMGHLA